MIQDEIFVFVTFDSIQKKRGVKYHNQLLWWSSFYEERKIPLYLGTRDSKQDLEKIKKDFESSIEYIEINENIPFCLMQEKYVYGNQYTILPSMIFIVQEQKIAKIYRRINKKTLENAYFTALEIKFKIFLKKFKKMIDSIQNLW